MVPFKPQVFSSLVPLKPQVSSSLVPFKPHVFSSLVPFKVPFKPQAIRCYLCLGSSLTFIYPGFDCGSPAVVVFLKTCSNFSLVYYESHNEMRKLGRPHPSLRRPKLSHAHLSAEPFFSAGPRVSLIREL